MDDSYSPNILTVTDDDGTEHVFEELDRIETDTDRYIALMPSYEDSEELLENDGELIIVKVREEGGETFLYTRLRTTPNLRRLHAFLKTACKIFLKSI